ncbi:hypothetical protein [Paraburkholderia fungorum]
MGACHYHDPSSSKPLLFQFEVKPGEVTETWAEELSLFHNPNAAIPVPDDMFPNIAHHRLQDGQFRSFIPEFHPYMSMTFHFSAKDD